MGRKELGVGQRLRLGLRGVDVWRGHFNCQPRLHLWRRGFKWFGNNRGRHDTCRLHLGNCRRRFRGLALGFIGVVPPEQPLQQARSGRFCAIVLLRQSLSLQAA